MCAQICILWKFDDAYDGAGDAVDTEENDTYNMI